MRVSLVEGFEEVEGMSESEKKETHKGKVVTFVVGAGAPPSRIVGTDLDEDIMWFAKSEEKSVKIQKPSEKMRYNLRSRVIALKKAKKVENVKVVSRTDKGKLSELWLVKE